MAAIRHVYASLYNDRAISYRAHHGFEHGKVAISAAVQRMVRSDRGASGVMFTLDTESGFRDVVFITSSWGLGEMVVQGAVNPDEFYVHKPMLAAGKPAILRRRLGTKLQKMVFSGDASAGQVGAHRGRGAGRARPLFAFRRRRARTRAHRLPDREALRPADGHRVGQGRPGRQHPRAAGASRDGALAQEARRGGALPPRRKGKLLASGRAIGHKIGAGPVKIVRDASKMASVKKGDVLVTDMTDPNWEPVMKLAAAIVTNRGGRTCHAAIIARELGIPAVVGCGDATAALAAASAVTVSCAEGDTGYVYEGSLPFEVITSEHGELPKIPVKIAMNIGNPALAFGFAQLPNAGVGLARLEFIINNEIGVHPRACIELARAVR